MQFNYLHNICLAQLYFGYLIQINAFIPNLRNNVCENKPGSDLLKRINQQINRVDTNDETSRKKRLKCLFLSSIDRANESSHENSPSNLQSNYDTARNFFSEVGRFCVRLTQNESENSKFVSQMRSSIKSSQPQIPIHLRIAKGIYEEITPWILTVFLPTVGSIFIQDSLPIQACFLGEFTFFLYCSSKLITHFDIPTKPEPLLGERKWENVFQSMWSSTSGSVESRRSCFMGFFYDVPFERLRREDALACLAWMRYGLPFEKQMFTEEMISNLENYDLPELEFHINNGKKLPPRQHGEETLGIMRFNLEPIRYRHKPLLYYFVTHSIFSCAQNKLVKELGFTYFPAKNQKTDLGYWYRPSRNHSQSHGTFSESDRSPLVFAHGIGGIAFYCDFIKDLVMSLDENTPIILLDLPFISLRVHDEIPLIESQVNSMCKILDSTVGRNKDGTPKKATFIGHSYGTILLSWMVQSNANRVNSCVFMDPICFQLHLKNILYNFHMQRMDKRIQSDNQWTNPFSLEGIVNLAGTEMHTNYATLRQFSWATNELWPEDILNAKNSALILLSEHDEIVPTIEVDKQITNFNLENLDLRGESFVKSHVFKNASHGEIFFSEELRQIAVRKVLAMERLNNFKVKTKVGEKLFQNHKNIPQPSKIQHFWHPERHTVNT